MRQVFKIHRFKVQRWTLLGLHRSSALRTGTSSSTPQRVLGLWCSAKFLRDRIFTDWPFTKFRRNNFRRWRIVVSHAHSDAAATPIVVLEMYKDIPVHIVKLLWHVLKQVVWLRWLQKHSSLRQWFVGTTCTKAAGMQQLPEPGNHITSLLAEIKAESTSFEGGTHESGSFISENIRGEPSWFLNEV